LKIIQTFFFFWHKTAQNILIFGIFWNFFHIFSTGDFFEAFFSRPKPKKRKTPAAAGGHEKAQRPTAADRTGAAAGKPNRGRAGAAAAANALNL
jgi:hypothetical protein